MADIFHLTLLACDDITEKIEKGVCLPLECKLEMAANTFNHFDTFIGVYLLSICQTQDSELKCQFSYISCLKHFLDT